MAHQRKALFAQMPKALQDQLEATFQGLPRVQALQKYDPYAYGFQMASEGSADPMLMLMNRAAGGDFNLGPITDTAKGMQSGYQAATTSPDITNPTAIGKWAYEQVQAGNYPSLETAIRTYLGSLNAVSP